MNVEHVIQEELPCLSCGYNLRGNTTGRCSECGGRFDYSDYRRRDYQPTVSIGGIVCVGLAYPILAQVIAVPAAAAAGGIAAFLTYAWGADEPFVLAAGFGVGAITLALPTWLVARDLGRQIYRTVRQRRPGQPGELEMRIVWLVFTGHYMATWIIFALLMGLLGISW